jgi:hypothetical protein
MAEPTGAAQSAPARKVVFCVPTVERPWPQFVESLEATVPAVKAAGWDDYLVTEVGNPYISAARAKLLRLALDVQPDAIVFLDHDLSWRPEDMVALLAVEHDVVAGTYRSKTDDDFYMGSYVPAPSGAPIRRGTNCILADKAPAGFLKITPHAVHEFMGAYPELVYGLRWRPFVDLFQHGAHEGVWWGEDYAFCRRWIAKCGELWILPDLDLTHHSKDKAYPGNYHRHLMALPGGKMAA